MVYQTAMCHNSLPAAWYDPTKTTQSGNRHCDVQSTLDAVQNIHLRDSCVLMEINRVVIVATRTCIQ
jgi:hypothetical protein